MIEPTHLIGQAAVYALIAAVVGCFASWPPYEQFPNDKAQVKLSFAHGAARKVACRKLSSKEIARLPPKQRRPNTCSRERLPMRVQLLLDGRMVYDAVLQPTGLARDGPAQTYQKFAVSPGRHSIRARMRDSGRNEGFDYDKSVTVELAPLQNLAIDFKADSGGFTFR